MLSKLVLPLVNHLTWSHLLRMCWLPVSQSCFDCERGVSYRLWVLRLELWSRSMISALQVSLLEASQALYFLEIIQLLILECKLGSDPNGNLPISRSFWIPFTPLKIYHFTLWGNSSILSLIIPIYTVDLFVLFTKTKVLYFPIYLNALSLRCLILNVSPWFFHEILVKLMKLFPTQLFHQHAITDDYLFCQSPQCALDVLYHGRRFRPNLKVQALPI